MANDKRVFKRSEVDPNWQQKGECWLADPVPGSVFSLDYCWPFRTRKLAQGFLQLVDSGMDADQAYHDVGGYHGEKEG